LPVTIECSPECLPRGAFYLNTNVSTGYFHGKSQRSKIHLIGKNTAFDVILGIILGSVVSRAINGSAAFFLTILAGFTLVTAHWLFSYIAFRSDHFGNVVKGSKRQLVQEGEIQWKEMGKSNISKEDLMSAVRMETNRESLDLVRKAYLERSGDISIIRQSKSPKILEVDVKEGVQTIRIQIE
jgi:uncharacterized membrane protein YcaP (DUF421 family)